MSLKRRVEDLELKVLRFNCDHDWRFSRAYTIGDIYAQCLGYSIKVKGAYVCNKCLKSMYRQLTNVEIDAAIILGVLDK